MIKKLLIITNTMDLGGAESFLMKIYRCIDKSKYQFDFYILGNKGFFDEEIISLGGKISFGALKTKKFIEYRRQFKIFLKSNNYSFIYRSISSSFSTIELFYAYRFSKIRNRVARSSNASDSSKIMRLLHFLLRPIVNLFSNQKIAPSKEAAVFVFGKRLVKKNKVIILPNGIDTEKFAFNFESRNLKRNILNIKDEELLFIHVGRFFEQKNHKYLFNVFSKILIQEPNAKLICIGEGELEEISKKLLTELNISKNVFIYKKISDVETFFNAADLMIFPSLYEGLPNVVMEAQGVSLPVVASDTITKECKVTKLVHFLPLNDAEEWADYCIKIAKHYKDNLSLREEIKFPKELDIKKIADRFVKIVFKD